MCYCGHTLEKYDSGPDGLAELLPCLECNCPDYSLDWHCELCGEEH